MAKFNTKIKELRHELDDLITYLENIGQANKKIRKVRRELDNIDPFVRLNSAKEADTLIQKNKLYILH